MNDNLFLHVDLKRLLKRLTACALRWFQEENLLYSDSVMPGVSESACSLAQNVITEALKDESVKWRPNDPDADPFPFLKQVMRRDFLDLVKKGRAYKRTVVMSTYGGDDVDKALDDFHSQDDGFEKAEAVLIACKLCKLADGEPELIEMIEAIVTCGYTKPEDIAGILSINLAEYTKRRRRLMTRLIRWKNETFPHTERIRGEKNDQAK